MAQTSERTPKEFINQSKEFPAFAKSPTKARASKGEGAANRRNAADSKTVWVVFLTFNAPESRRTRPTSRQDPEPVFTVAPTHSVNKGQWIVPRSRMAEDSSLERLTPGPRSSR